LRCSANHPVSFHRLGSFGRCPYGNVLDGFEVFCPLCETTPQTIFLDMYQLGHQEAERAPEGFHLDSAPFSEDMLRPDKSDPNIKHVLRRDFGLLVRIASGDGTRSAPYVIEACEDEDAARTALDVLLGMGLGTNRLWRTLHWHEAGSDGVRRLEVIR